MPGQKFFRKHLQLIFTFLNSLQVGILGEIDFACTPLANFLKNLVVRDGLSDHAIPLTQCSWAQWYARGVLKAMGNAVTYSMRSQVRVLVSSSPSTTLEGGVSIRRLPENR